MAIYEFKTQDGEIVARRFSMNACPSEIILEDGRVATRIMSLTARMSRQWDSYEPSDLPPVNSPLIP